jgi:hypothetical protein
LPRAKPRRVSVLRAFTWPRLFLCPLSLPAAAGECFFVARAGDDDDLGVQIIAEKEYIIIAAFRPACAGPRID